LESFFKIFSLVAVDLTKTGPVSQEIFLYQGLKLGSTLEPGPSILIKISPRHLADFSENFNGLQAKGVELRPLPRPECEKHGRNNTEIVKVQKGRKLELDNLIPNFRNSHVVEELRQQESDQELAVPLVQLVLEGERGSVSFVIRKLPGVLQDLEVFHYVSSRRGEKRKKEETHDEVHEASDIRKVRTEEVG